MKWPLRVLKVALVVVGIMLAIQVFVLPWAVHRAVSSTLRGMGLSDVRFEVRAASFFGADLARVDIDPEKLAYIGNVSVDYTPRSLLHGRVRGIWITGAEIQIGVRGGRVDLGALTVRTASGGSVKAEPGPLPFDRLELRSSTLALDWEGRRVWIPVQATVTGQDSGRVKVDGVARVQGAPVHITFRMDRAADVLTIDADAQAMDAAMLVAAVPARFGEYAPAISGGMLAIRANYRQDPSGSSTRAEVNAQDLRLGMNVSGHRIWAQDIDWSGDVELDSHWQPVQGQLKASVERMSVDGEAMRDVSIEGRKEGDRIVASARARGADWILRDLRANLAGLLDASENERSVELSISIQGALPKTVQNLLLLQRVDASRLGSISIEGNATARIDAAAKWKMLADNVQVGLAPGELTIGKEMVVAHGLAGALRVSASADQNGATISLLPGSNLWAENIAQKAAPITLAKQGAGAIAAIGIELHPATLSLRFNDPAHSWAAAVPAATVTLNDVAIGSEFAALNNAKATVRLNARADPKSTQVRLLEGSSISLAGVVSKMNGREMRAGPWHLTLAASKDAPLVMIDSAETRIALSAAADQPLVIKGQDMDAQVPGVTIAWGSSIGRDLHAEVGFSGADMTYRPMDLKLGGISARIPFAAQRPDLEQQPFEVKSVHIGADTFPPVSGKWRIVGRRADFQAATALLSSADNLTVSGWVDFSLDEPFGRIEAKMPSFQISDETAVARLLPVLANFNVKGTLAASGHMDFARGQIKPLVSVSLKDVEIASKQYERAIKGVNGTVSFDSFSPLSTPGGQKLEVRQATIGKLQLRDSVLVFRVEDATRIHVEGTEWGWASGRIYTSSFRFDATKPLIDTVVSADHVDLGGILATFAEDQASGEGLLYGRLPVKVSWPVIRKDSTEVVDWSKPHLETGDGFMYAMEGAGRLQVQNAQQVLGDVLKQDPRLAQGGAMEQVRSNIIRALQDLDYTVLKVDFDKQQDVARVQVAGKGHGGNPQEIGRLTLNIRGFQEALNFAMFVQRSDFSLGK